jgi:hypothetical protein
MGIAPELLGDSGGLTGGSSDDREPPKIEILTYLKLMISTLVLELIQAVQLIGFKRLCFICFESLVCSWGSVTFCCLGIGREVDRETVLLFVG